MLKYSSYLKNFLLVVASLLITISVIEYLSYLYFNRPKSHCINCWKHDFSQPIGKWNRKNFSHDAIKKCADGSECYRVNFRYDEFGRRILGNEKESDKYLLYFGCSFTVGEGLNSPQTLPFLTQAKSDYRVYSYAKSGSGVSTALRLLRSGKVSKEVPQKDGVAIYVLANVHVVRDSFEASRIAALRTPAYEIINDDVVYVGNQLDALRLKKDIISRMALFYIWLYKRSYFLKSLKLQFSNIDGEERQLKHLRLLKELKEEYQRKFQGRFVVLGHPRSPPTKEQTDFLKQQGIEYYSTELNRPISDYFICKCDWHTNRELNSILSDFVVEELLD